MGRYTGFEITLKQRSYPTSVDEGTTVLIISGMNFCNFKICPLDTPRNPIWWLVSNPILQSEIANGIPIYRGHNSQNWPIPILVYGQQVYRLGLLQHSTHGVAFFERCISQVLRYRRQFCCWFSWHNRPLTMSALKVHAEIWLDLI